MRQGVSECTRLPVPCASLRQFLPPRLPPSGTALRFQRLSRTAEFTGRTRLDTLPPRTSAPRMPAPSQPKRPTTVSPVLVPIGGEIIASRCRNPPLRRPYRASLGLGPPRRFGASWSHENGPPHKPVRRPVIECRSPGSRRASGAVTASPDAVQAEALVSASVQAQATATPVLRPLPPSCNSPSA